MLLPALFAPMADFVEALAKSGAVVLMGPRSGSKTPDFQIPPGLPPDRLRALVDLRVRRVESLRPGATIAIEDAVGRFEGWREFLVLGEGVEAEMKSTDGEVALARSGNSFYLAGRPDKTLLGEVLHRIFARAGIAGLDLREDIRIRDNGATRFIFNYGREPVDISGVVGDASLLLGERVLASCGVAAFVRRADR